MVFRVLLVILSVTLSIICFGQSKKEQIAILSYRIDSITKILGEERLNSQDFQKKSESEAAVYLRKIDELNKEKSSIIQKFNDLNKDFSLLTNQYKDIENKYKQVNLSFHITNQNEVYTNCAPKFKYRKERCSELILSYPEVTTEIETLKEDTEIINEVIQELLLNESLKDDRVKEFSTQESEFWQEENTTVSNTYLSNQIISFVKHGYLWAEEAPCIYLAGNNSVIFDLVKKKKLSFEELFKANSETEIKRLIIEHLDEDEKGVLPESGNLDEFNVEFLEVFISNKENRIGFCFFVGEAYDCLDQINVCIPFEKCKGILRSEYLNIFN